MIKKRLILVVLLAVGLSIAIALRSKHDNHSTSEHYNSSFINLLDLNEQGFLRTNTPWDFQFPRDHGAHSDYKSESWYLTGYITTTEGRIFGFQLLFFRIGLKPPGSVQRTSSWATTEIYRGQFALTDVVRDKFNAAERFSRAALGLSGSWQMPVRIRLYNWKLDYLDEEQGLPSFQARATDVDVGMDLVIRSLKPAILFDGSRFSDTAMSSTNFYSYSLTRLHSQGAIQVGADVFHGEGSAWLDHAWGWIPVPYGPIVWDRFLLQLEDGTELMVLKRRRRAGGGEPVTIGMKVNHDGSIKRFGDNKVSINILDTWKNPRDGTHYPARWQLQIPSESLDLEITPHIANQSIDLAMPYWGGMVYTQGKINGSAVSGQGFVELTGYAVN